MMKKMMLFCFIVFMFCSTAMAAQQKSDYVSPNFNPQSIHSIAIIGQLPAESIQYVVEDNLLMSLPAELKKSMNISNIKTDTMMDIIVKVQKISGKNILAMMQSQNNNQQQEALKLVWDYIGANYDTIININVLQANYTEKYSAGYTYTTTENQRSTISNVYGQMANIDTPIQREHTVGRGMVDVAQILLNITVHNANEVVMSRREFRNKRSFGIAATTPEDIGRRIVSSFAHDLSKALNKK